MGVKFGREYEEIVEDLTTAIGQIKGCYEFFEMTAQDWNELEQEEKQECLKTLADDVFFALGTSRTMEVGSGSLIYDKKKHLITVDQVIIS